MAGLLGVQFLVGDLLMLTGVWVNESKCFWERQFLYTNQFLSLLTWLCTLPWMLPTQMTLLVYYLLHGIHSFSSKLFWRCVYDFVCWRLSRMMGWSGAKSWKFVMMFLRETVSVMYINLRVNFLICDWAFNWVEVKGVLYIRKTWISMDVMEGKNDGKFSVCSVLLKMLLLIEPWSLH